MRRSTRCSALLERWRAALALFRTPSARNPDPHHRGATGFWHFGLGVIPGAGLGLCGWPVIASAVWIAAIYFLVKEVRDIRRGGRRLDSVEDALFVAMGGAVGSIAPEVGALVIPAHLAALFVMLAQVKTDE